MSVDKLATSVLLWFASSSSLPREEMVLSSELPSLTVGREARKAAEEINFKSGFSILLLNEG